MKITGLPHLQQYQELIKAPTNYEYCERKCHWNDRIYNNYRLFHCILLIVSHFIGCDLSINAVSVEMINKIYKELQVYGSSEKVHKTARWRKW